MIVTHRKMTNILKEAVQKLINKRMYYESCDLICLNLTIGNDVNKNIYFLASIYIFKTQSVFF